MEEVGTYIPNLPENFSTKEAWSAALTQTSTLDICVVKKLCELANVLAS